MHPYRLYVDSADEAAVAGLLAEGLVDGVTTNPTLLLRSGHGPEDIPRLHHMWRSQGASRIFFQTWGHDSDSMLAHAQRLAALGEDVTVKVPATRTGIAVGHRLSSSGIPVLVTAVYSAAQAIAASAIGAEMIAPYLGRLNDAGLDGAALITQMHNLLKGTPTVVLAASIRSPEALLGLADHGIHAFTAAPNILWALIDQALSESAASTFEDDMAKAGR